MVFVAGMRFAQESLQRCCCAFIACKAAFAQKVPRDFYDTEIEDITKSCLGVTVRVIYIEHVVQVSIKAP